VLPIKRARHEYANVANASQRPMFKCGLQSSAAYINFNNISCSLQSKAAKNRVNTAGTQSTTGKSKRERCESAKTNFAHDDVMKYVIRALQWKLPRAPLIRRCSSLQFLTAKISGCALKQRSKTHSSLCQSNLQLQNEAAHMSCQIRAVDHIRKCAAGLSDAHPGLRDRILLNHRRIENAHKVRKKTFDFLFCIEHQQILGFPFSLLRHYQMPESLYVNNCCFWARTTVLSCYRNW